MGFVEKLKSLFKKKNAAEPAAKKAKVAVKREAEFGGQGKVADALRFAAAKIDTKVEAGLDVKKADMYMASLKAVEASADADEVKLIQISQIIGGIVNA